jgi:hypothetical protein
MTPTSFDAGDYGFTTAAGAAGELKAYLTCFL